MAQKARTIILNGFELTSFASNYISTTKYNLFTFLPLSLFLQFRRIANIYFLITAILQSIPEISPLNPFSAIAPLIFVLAVSMVREGIEDYLRHKADQEINSSKTHLYEEGHFKKRPYKDVKVGHLVLVQKDEIFPCDLIMLSNSDELGVAFIETSSLDGEKNLKQRLAFNETMGNLEKEGVIRIITVLECDRPNPKLYDFNGKILYNGNYFSLDKNNLLLAGALLRNTEWVIGVAVYTGIETKLRQNLVSRTYKSSKIEKIVNEYVVGIIMCQVFLCLIGAVLYNGWVLKDNSHWYISESDYSAETSGFLNFFTYFLLLNTMLPISLIISLEIVKLIQGLAMQEDQRMYSKRREKYCKVSSFTLNEELGQIQHVFTDKTGTLTANRMEFKACSIGTFRYGEKFLESTFKRTPTYTDPIVSFTFDPQKLIEDTHEKLSEKTEIFPFKAGNFKIKSQASLNNHFLRCLALCHECLIEKDEMKRIRYVGQSPDEIALVDSARWAGYTLKKKVKEVYKLKIEGPKGSLSYGFNRAVLFEFTSERRRNSVIVHDLINNEYFLYIKGADNMILERLAEDNNPEILNHTLNEVSEFAQRGFRTLLIAFKALSENEFEEIKSRYENVAVEIEGREVKLEELADEVERGLYLLGCTAVEDSLQHNVPETISDILAAGVKMWMLTGDKLETAENIGKTCKLINDDMIIIRINTVSLKETYQEVYQTYQKLKENKNSFGKEAAIIIEGCSLEYILFDPEDLESLFKNITIYQNEQLRALAIRCREYFFKSAEMCKTIICCRTTPGQKRDVVKFIKKRTESITLSIGDGANDVSMLLEAHIGVGVYGEEGMQAVEASDFAIGEFRYLWELMFYHGRYNYIRQSELIMYFFYKNLVFTLPEFYFMFYCAYSGETVYDDWYITCYNLIFTAFPLLVRGIYEIDILIPIREQLERTNEEKDEHKASTVLENVRFTVPLVYSIGKDNELFTPENFFLWLLFGVFHSILVFFVPFYAADEGVLGSEGFNHTLWTFSITSFTCVIVVVNIKFSFYTRHWNLFHHVAIWITSIILYIIFIIVYDLLTERNGFGTINTLLVSYYFYMSVLVVVFFVVAIDGGSYLLRRVFWPTSSEILMDYSIRNK